MMKTLYLSILSLASVLCCLPTIQAENPAGRVLKANNSAVRYTGRTQVQPDGSVSFDWVGTYLETAFTGGAISLQLSETGTSYYNVFVDGKLHRVVKACGIDTLICFVSGVSRKLHSLRIQKRTEGEFGRTTIHHFLLSPFAILQAEPATRTRYIEFIGNSLTCGYGVEGKDRNELFRLETENCDLSFATIVARYFDADYTLIAHSGRGVVRNYGDSVRVSAVTMKDRMLRTFDESSDFLWDFKGYRPDLVIINLGTNDFSVEPHPYKSEFVKAYTQILRQLRHYYGNVPVLCLYSCTISAPVYSYYEAVLSEMNDKQIYLLPLQKDLLDDTSDLGAVWHPNYSGHRKMAMSLIPYISTLTGWELPAKAVE
ncbi:SGNH/GDSL hydrolase family protein [Bacteroides heparinolyticus]|uniref:SGNH/GDSL hydrolase family protein n=1 Tax=Prevotella heparinolytica TaxID=28113 RepID=UPI00359FE20F